MYVDVVERSIQTGSLQSSGLLLSVDAVHLKVQCDTFVIR